MSAPYCVFKCNDVPGKIIKFSENNLQECRDKLLVRIALNMKYNDIVFPDHVNDDFGYHSACRKNFLAIPKKYLQSYEEIKSTGKMTNTDSSLVAAPCTSFANVSGNFNIYSNSLY